MVYYFNFLNLKLITFRISLISKENLWSLFYDMVKKGKLVIIGDGGMG